MPNDTLRQRYTSDAIPRRRAGGEHPHGWGEAGEGVDVWTHPRLKSTYSPTRRLRLWYRIPRRQSHTATCLLV